MKKLSNLEQVNLVNGTLKGFHKYIEEHSLCREAEVCMVDEGYWYKFKAYIRKYPLSVSAEKFLFSMIDTTYLRMYMNKWGLYEKLEVELAMYGEEELVRYYAERHDFCDKAAEALKSRDYLFYVELTGDDSDCLNYHFDPEDDSDFWDN